MLLTLLAAGAWAWRRKELQAAYSFLGDAALATVPAVVAPLAAFGLLAEFQIGASQLLPGMPFLNAQLCAGALASAFLGGTLWALLRGRVFAWVVVCIGSAALLAGACTAGLLDRAPWERWLFLLPLVVALPLGTLLESKRRPRWASPFHVVGLGALIAFPAAAACSGILPGALVDGWLLGAPVALFAHAILLLGVREVLARRVSLDLRRDARVLGWVAPVILLGATGWNAWALGHAGAVGLHVLAAGTLLAWATMRRNRSIALVALAGLAAGSLLLFLRAQFPPVYAALGVVVAGAVLAFGVLLRRPAD